MSDFHYIWHWRTKLPERRGQRCRIVERKGDHEILVEFEDGFRVATSRFAVRQA